jgi:hypothetical protein
MWQYTHVPGVEVRFFHAGVPYFRYRLATDRDRPFGHPVTVASPLPGSSPPEPLPALTCLAPHDHAWHAGFWFSWKFVNGVNYWEHAADGRPEGRLGLEGPERLVATPEAVVLEATYAYLSPNPRAPGGYARVASETRRLTWHRPEPDGSHRLDAEIAFQAPADAPGPVVLDRTPITPQTPWGGYAGLSWRFARGLGEVDGLDAEGRRHRAIEHQRAAWATIWGRLDGGPDLRAGVAIFDHPSNPGYPTHWRYIADPGFTYLNPSPLLAAPIAVPPGETLRLRYRVLVYPGRADAERLAREFARFAEREAR